MTIELDSRIVVTREGPITTVTLDYAERRNALDVPMRETLHRLSRPRTTTRNAAP